MSVWSIRLRPCPDGPIRSTLGLVADEVTGQPFEDGEEPEDRDHGAADDGFAAVVFDEDFVRAAKIHEPTAAERMLAAAQSRAENEQPPADETYGPGGFGPGPFRLGWGFSEAERQESLDEPRYGGHAEDGYTGFRDERDYREYAAYQEFRDSEDTPGYRGGQVRWHRPVAWVLAVVMGVGVVAMAFAAVYRGGSAEREEPAPPPATSELDEGLGKLPSVARSSSHGGPASSLE